MRIFATAFWVSQLAAPALASTHVDQPLFECTVLNGAKTLAVTVNPPFVYYSFGPEAAPEIVIEKTISDVGVTPWNGVGRSIFEEIEFLVGGHFYRVYHNFDRNDHVHSGGVSVWRGDEELISIACDKGTTTVDGGVFGFLDLKQDAGFCWDFDALEWRHDCAN